MKDIVDHSIHHAEDNKRYESFKNAICFEILQSGEQIIFVKKKYFVRRFD